MNETITSAHSSRSRRTVAILTWIGLVIAAALLWRGRLTGAMRTDSSEVAAILLAAYTTFASIFAWMLFSPSRHASEDSLALFFSGGLTLIPTCIIAFCLMPPDSPLRGWLTAVVFLITVIAVMSPIPVEFFGVPRERSSYFRPISESLFENVEMRHLIDGFDYLKDQVPEVRSAVLVHSAPVETAIPGTIARDPWQDPFRGTDVRPAQVESQPAPPVQRQAVQARNHQDTERTPERKPERDQVPVMIPRPPVTEENRVLREPTVDRRPLPTEKRTSPDVFKPSPPANPPAPAAPAAPAFASPVTVAPAPVVPAPVVPAPVAPAPVAPPKVSVPPVVARTETPTAPSASGIAARVTPPPVPAAKPVVPASPPAVTPLGFVSPTLPLPTPIPPAPIAPTPTKSPAPSSKPDPKNIAESDYDSAFEHWASQDNDPDRDAESEDDDAGAGHDLLDDEPLKFERIQDGLGGEMIEGTIRVVFEPGQKRANLHVPFSPPLKGVPDVDCEPTGSDDLRLKVPVKQPYGIRIEARRSDASERLETEIGFAAICSHKKR